MVTRKTGSDTKQEILQTGLRLIQEKGYDSTTIKDIINQLDISKGAFYHYFDSKEDLIEEIAINYSRKALSIIKEIAAREDLSGVEKINQVIQAVSEFKGDKQEKRQKIKSAFSGDQNLKLRKKLNHKIKREAIPAFQEIIEEGQKEGSITTENSREMAELLLFLIRSLNSSLDELIAEQDYDESSDLSKYELMSRIEEKIVFYEKIMAKVLNLKTGEIVLKEPYFNRYFK